MKKNSKKMMVLSLAGLMFRAATGFGCGGNYDVSNPEYRTALISNKNVYIVVSEKGVDTLHKGDIKPNESDFVKTKDLGLNYKFLDNVLDILYRSEFLGKKTENLSLVNNGELVLNLSKPYVDKETNSMNYNLTIAKLHDNDLKLGTFVVSAPLDDGLKENPKSIYAMPSEKVKIEKVETKTYKDVFQVEMHDDYTLIV